MVPKMETNLSNTVEIFQHHQPKIPPFSWGSKKVIRSRKVNCSAIFKTNPTDRGMCCTFNALAAEEIYRWPASGSAFTCFYALHYFYVIKYLIEMTDAFRKSQFSESVANLQKENVRDSFENPPGLPEGWILNPIGFLIQVFFLAWAIALFRTGGANQGMNQDLKLVSLFKALVLQVYFATISYLSTNNIPLAEEVNCTVT